MQVLHDVPLVVKQPHDYVLLHVLYTCYSFVLVSTSLAQYYSDHSTAGR